MTRDFVRSVAPNRLDVLGEYAHDYELGKGVKMLADHYHELSESDESDEFTNTVDPEQL
jgi:hypothetical protein